MKLLIGYMILNNVIGSIHHYHNILFVIVCLLCIHNVVHGVKHDVSSVLYQHCQYEVMIHLVYTNNMYHRKNSIEIWDENVLYLADCSFLCFTMFGTTKKTLFSSLLNRIFLNSALSEVNSLIPKPF